MSWLEDCFIVLVYSTKTQLAIIAGLTFFFGSLATGHYGVSTILGEVHSPIFILSDFNH